MSMDNPASPWREAEPSKDDTVAALYVELAREQHVIVSDNKIEIDSDAKVSFADEGAWVAAWVWVRRPESWGND